MKILLKTLTDNVQALGEKLVIDADTPGGMRTCSLRPAAIYGPRDNDQIPGSMQRILQGRAKTQIGDNTNLFDRTYSGNAADAHLLAAEKLVSAPDGVGGEAFFITDGTPLPMWDFIRKMAEFAGRPVPLDQVRIISPQQALWLAWIVEWIDWFRGQPSPFNRTTVRYTTMNRYYSIEKARKRLGYMPGVEWTDGLRESVEVKLL
jgi:sterol-4alpha-carboxylate 3-dehydrogenase (decarboxylating)